MAFSFNWAGTNINQIDPNQSRQAYDDAKNLGEAAAGLRKRIGMSQYADLIRNGSGGNSARIAEIQAEIKRLEDRNKELQNSMAASQQMQGYAPNPGAIAAQQMQGYGQFQDYVNNMGPQQGPASNNFTQAILASIAASQGRSRY